MYINIVKMSSVYAVSYTHLDVYKRQSWHSGGEVETMSLCTPENELPEHAVLLSKSDST